MTVQRARTAEHRPAYSHTRRNSQHRIAASLAGAKSTPFWLDSPDRPQPLPPLGTDTAADLVVVGGGYCGLWTALIAKEAHPERDIVLVEAKEVGWAASGRNGGFCEASLTHGAQNGERHFADELDVLERIADENFAELEATLKRHDIDAQFEKTGVLVAATEEYQVRPLRAAAAATSDAVFLDEVEVQQAIASPLYRAGLRKSKGYAYVHPAKLAWGLKRACRQLGVRIFESTPATRLSRSGDAMTVVTPGGVIRTQQVALATNGFPSLLKRTSLLTVPVYDYALMTEPLSDAQLQSIGWTTRHGITDSSHQFHYARLSADNRILWGGYDAVYHRGGRIRRDHDQRRETFETLADHFFSTFPQLADVRFTHAWGGMIDMSSRLVAFHGRAFGGRVAYSAGFTGLGVGATRFGAKVMLDLLSGDETDLTRLRMVRSKPIPIPPEPIAYPVIQTIRRAVVRSDENEGRDGLILRAMDRLGVSFDS